MSSACKTAVCFNADTAPRGPHPLNLIKLSVGSESVESLAEWQSARVAERAAREEAPRPRHITRMTPRRQSELLPGGSIYWVIQGRILARQPLHALVPVTGEDGISRCAILMEPCLIRTEPRAKRPFQGWRYLTGEDAPPDLQESGADIDQMPLELREELARFGLD